MNEKKPKMPLPKHPYVCRNAPDIRTRICTTMCNSLYGERIYNPEKSKKEKALFFQDFKLS